MVVGHSVTEGPAPGAALRLADSQRKAWRNLEGPWSPWVLCMEGEGKEASLEQAL